MNSKLSPDIIGHTVVNEKVEGDYDGGNGNNNDKNNYGVAQYDEYDPNPYHPFN